MLFELLWNPIHHCDHTGHAQGSLIIQGIEGDVLRQGRAMDDELNPSESLQAIRQAYFSGGAIGPAEGGLGGMPDN